MSSTAHLYGWNDEASCLECVRDDKQPVLCLGMQDCVILSSQDNQAITLHRRYDEDCGLLEKCFSSRPNDLVITKFSNSNNHGVYVDSSNTVWSYDHDLNRVESSTGSTSATILAFNGQVASTNIEKGPEDGNEESIEQQLLVQIQKSKDCMFANHRHNLIASTMLIKQIATGTSHCLLLTQSCELYSFGTGSCGELGIGTTIPHTNEPQRVVFHGNLGVKYVAAGAYYSAAITTDGVLFTFGCGAYYRLGHGSDANCNVPKKVEALEGVGQLLPDGTSTGTNAILYCTVDASYGIRYI